MSVIITIKIRGDVDTFRAAVTEKSDDLKATSERGRAAGALHHRFGVGDGYVLVVDEWESVEHFEKFFGAPELQQTIAGMGGDTSVPPEITVAEAISTVDEF